MLRLEPTHPSNEITGISRMNGVQQHGRQTELIHHVRLVPGCRYGGAACCTVPTAVDYPPASAYCQSGSAVMLGQATRVRQESQGTGLPIDPVGGHSARAGIEVVEVIAVGSDPHVDGP